MRRKQISRFGPSQKTNETSHASSHASEGVNSALWRLVHIPETGRRYVFFISGIIPAQLILVLLFKTSVPCKSSYLCPIESFWHMMSSLICSVIPQTDIAVCINRCNCSVMIYRSIVFIIRMIVCLRLYTPTWPNDAIQCQIIFVAPFIWILCKYWLLYYLVI